MHKVLFVMTLMAGLWLASSTALAQSDGDPDLIGVSTYCTLQPDFLVSFDDPPLAPVIGAEWRSVAEGVVITKATIGGVFGGGDFSFVEVPGPGTHTFDQTLTIEVNGVEQTLDYSLPVDCTEMRTTGRSVSGATEVYSTRTTCRPPTGGDIPTDAEISYQWAFLEDGYSVAGVTHDLPGTVLELPAFGIFNLIIDQKGERRFLSVDGSITVTYQPDGGGPDLVEAYPVDLDITCLILDDVPIDFVDDNNSRFEDEIEWLAAQGITRGCDSSGTRFCPNDRVTRGQMAAFLVRALGYTDRGSIDFTDDDTSTFEADIERLATAGITQGCDSTAVRFCPDDPVTRGQMAAFLHRALDGELPAGTSPDFVDDDGSIFEGDIEWLAATGITLGCDSSGTRFCPSEPVTRGQMAAFLYRALGDG